MALLFFRTMSLARRMRHQAWRRQLVRKAFYFYILAFIVFFLKLHFVGIKSYYPSFHREYLPVNAAALQAVSWALIGPVGWVLHKYVLRGTELWRSFSNLDGQMQRLVLAGVLLAIGLTVFVWRVMLPFWGLAAAVAWYLRFSRPKDSL